MTMENATTSEVEKSGSDTETEITAVQLRKTLNKFLINVFSELNRADLSNFSKCISRLRYCLEGFPQIFISHSSTKQSIGVTHANEHPFDVALAFTEWLMMRLLQILNQSYPPVVHDGCEELFTSLMQVVRTTDPPSFRRFSLLLLTLLTDLNTASKSFAKGCAEDFIIQHYFTTRDISCLKESEGLDLSDIPIVISSPTECGHLQKKLTQMLPKLSYDLVLFLPDQYCNIWKILCLQIETGFPELKEVSLIAVTAFTESEGLPKYALQVSYILDCLQALVIYCCSTEISSLPSSFESSVAASFIAVINALQVENMFFHLNDFVVIRILESLMQCIICHGFSRIKCENLREAIAKGIVKLISCLQFSKQQLNARVFSQFQTVVCQHLEEFINHEFLVPIFLCFVSIEASEKPVECNSVKNASSKSLEPEEYVIKPKALSRRFFSTPAPWCVSLPIYLKMKYISSTWSSVLESLATLLKKQETNSFSEENSASVINAIRICLEVLLQSSSSLLLSKSPESFIPLSFSKAAARTNDLLLPPDNFSLLLNNLQKLCFVSQIENFGIFKELVDLCGCIISFQDFLPLTTSEYNTLCSILSLPWLAGKEGAMCDLCFDLPISASSLANVPSEVVVQCVQYLSMLRCDIAPQWRFFVLKDCLKHQEFCIQRVTAQVLPWFLHAQIISNDDLQDLLREVLESRTPELCCEVAKVLGNIICVLMTSGVTCRRRDSDGSLMFLPEIVCKVCSIGQLPAQATNSVNSELEIPWLSSLFVSLLTHSDSNVRKEAVSSIPSYFMHNRIDKTMLGSVLDLVSDASAEVQSKFSGVVKYVLKQGKTATVFQWTPDMNEILITKLKAALHFAKSNGNMRMQETILKTICELGKVAENGILLICVISLLENLFSSVPLVVATARFKMKEIALSKGFKMVDIFKLYREPICKFLAESMVAYSTDDAQRALNVLQEIRLIFGYCDVKSFLGVTQQLLLPYLVSKEADPTSALLNLMSRILNTNKRDLLMNNFPFIFSHLVRHCDKAELEKALLYVERETELEFGSLLRCSYQHIHNELLLHISTHYEQVFAGLATLALKSEDGRGRKCVLKSREDMANYLQPKLLGFLVFFDSQLLKSSVTLDDKKLALESLIVIMELMGQRHITAVRFKVMATLRIALRFKDDGFPKICCQAWNAFVHSIEMTSLGPLLNQVIVALLPLLELEPDMVSDIFSYLIIENQASLSEFFHDLYFIPERPKLRKIHVVLRQYSKNPSSQSDFQTLLSHSLKGISHENLEVRLHALAKLKQVLTLNQVSLYEHLLGRESVDHFLSDLISVVMSSCRETDIRARSVLGECLGALGAVDPGRLEMKKTNSKETSTGFLSTIEDDNFAFALIQELAHSFLAAADCRVQDCSAFAIQEVLRIYRYSEPKPSSSKAGSHLWRRFPDDIREILDVLSRSQYKPLEKTKQGFPRPIYRSSAGSKFSDWVTNWFTDLLSKVRQEMAAKLFHSCSMIIKHDLNCALFLLPHIIIYSLLDSTEAEKEEIISEVMAVLTDCEQSSSSPSDLCHLGSQTIFSVCDHLVKWTRCRRQALTTSAGPARSSVVKPSQDPGLVTVGSFLAKIPNILLAKSSLYCQAYSRALMYLEQHLKDNPSELEANLSFLQKLYASLDEPDGVSGVAAMRTEEPSLKDAILDHEAIGDMQAAFACYEKAVNVYPDEVSYYGGLLKCFLRMDQPNTALTYANGIMNDRPQWEEELNSYRVEAAWKLANWKALESFLEKEPQSDKWNVGVGKILRYAECKDLINFKEEIQKVRCSQMAPLSAASMENGAYLRGYEYLTRLHMLMDLEQNVQTFLFSENLSAQESSLLADNLLSEWKLRQQLVQSSLRYQEPILDFHRILLQMDKAKYPDLSAKFDQQVATCWLESAKLARKSGHQQRAYSCLLEASVIDSPVVFMEKTKWYWAKGEKEQAISCLQKGIEEHFSGCKASSAKARIFASEERFMCAKAKLLLSVYSEESAIVDSSRLIQMYKEIVALHPSWEESHFHLAKYYDKMLGTLEKLETKAEVMVHIAKGFGTSLRYGCKHIYHSLPRLLDIWFDMGTQIVEHQGASKKSTAMKTMETALNQLTTVIIPDLFESLPLFLFMTAFPQMISRICHSHVDVAHQLQKIIAKLLVEYSQQCIWMMIAVSKSSYPMRIQRCRKIFQDAVTLKPELSKFIQDTTRLADKLIELSNKNVCDTNTLSINEHFQILPKMVGDKNFSRVMLPLQAQMNVTLPSGHSSTSDHNPFPFTPICIQGFEDTVEIFPSLQRPKKLIIRGSDGNKYGIICKPKDDLRKDCRLMEFNNLVNRYLLRDPEARKRQLYIRTYAVIPLNEECGLIEWVPNLSGLRLIITRIYKNKGIYVSGKDVKAMMPHRTATPEQKLGIFMKKFLPKFPPVFNEWFLSTFPDPTAWYLARLAYARTTAVMSMVGYIVGLGDRHGENILFDSSCGDTVHVDLNCLFNKGETMECPECVPFRLTHNMVRAMGPTGYEGIYRRACEATMRVMRSQTDALMSVLRPFVHDPLVEWSRSFRGSRVQPPTAGEIRNEMGLIHVKDIEQRLKGTIRSKNKPQGLPLSIEGQVNHLIQEATDNKNLSQMYIGWTAYM